MPGFRTMPAPRLILLRHAEKPNADDDGVNIRGTPDANELSVRGWQRSGALARLFAPGGGEYGVPKALFAERPCEAHPSRRCISTLQPLAERLGLRLDLSFRRGEEAELAHALARREGLALAAWDHRHLGRIAQALLGCAGISPQDWSEEVFDRFWIFSREDVGWKFEDRPQRLLAGDAAK